jgi:hypothetical protein
MKTSWVTKANTALALGPSNIAQVFWYRARVRIGWHPAQRLRAVAPVGPFFAQPTRSRDDMRAPSLWLDGALLFGHEALAVGDVPPDWTANPMTGRRFPDPERPWWRIPDFDPAVGDIKLIWELSRMDWAVGLAQHAALGNARALDRLNAWLKDWSVSNHPYQGPNWKCGQEASIRVLHLAVAALVLGAAQRPLESLRQIVELHLRRISPTIHYAVAQDNNHGTSEAAALYVGGGWLASLGVPEGTIWQESGRRVLEERLQRLVGPQGTFSQYSLNYHRMLLDTLCIVEVWRRHMGLPRLADVLWPLARRSRCRDALAACLRHPGDGRCADSRCQRWRTPAPAFRHALPRPSSHRAVGQSTLRC